MMRSRVTTWIERGVNVAILVVAVIAVLIYRERRVVLRASVSDDAAPPPTSYHADWRAFVDDGVTIGSTSAPMHIVEFADFECPACRRVHALITRLRADARDSVALTFVHFPLSYHRFAMIAARASDCAQRQGRFAQMHDLLFQLQDSLGLKSFDSFAVDAGVSDADAFRSCLNARDTLHTVQRGLATGRRIQLLGTPTVLVNGWIIPPSHFSETRFAAAVREAAGRGAAASAVPSRQPAPSGAFAASSR